MIATMALDIVANLVTVRRIINSTRTPSDAQHSHASRQKISPFVPAPTTVAEGTLVAEMRPALSSWAGRKKNSTEPFRFTPYFP